MDSYLDPDSYEPVFICNICNNVLTEPVCRNDHITNINSDSLAVDFESIIKPTVVRNRSTSLDPVDVSSKRKVKVKVYAVIPPKRSQHPSHYLCPRCGEISENDKCRKKHDFQPLKDICTTCGVECESVEALLQHRTSCISENEYFVKTNELTLTQIATQVIQTAALNLPENFACMVEKGTLGTGQYQVRAALIEDSDLSMDMKDTVCDREFRLPLEEDMDKILEWDESMSLAILDAADPTCETFVFDDFPQPDLGKAETSKHDRPKSPEVVVNELKISTLAENRTLLSCEICKEDFPDVDTFIPHYMTHGSSERFVCQFCSRFYTRMYWFRAHMKNHADQLPIVCKFCDEYFLSSKLHDEHLHSVHQMSNAEVEKLMESINAKQKNPFMCMKCGRWLKSAKHLDMHQEMHKMVKARLVSADKLIYSNKDPSASTSVSLPTERFPTKEKNKPIHIFECNICSAHIKSIDEVRQHLLSHSENRLFKCEACGERFTTTAVLLQHNCGRAEAIPNNKHECKQCGKEFSHAAGLACHARTHEAQMEAFSCDKCPQKFKVLSSYLIHRVKSH